MKLFRTFFTITAAIAMLASCSPAPEQPSGALYIIGGGSRPESMMKEMVEMAGLEDGNKYGIVLPMSSGNTESAFQSMYRELTGLGAVNIYNFNVEEGEVVPESRLDSIRNADFIYMTGGVQSRFMNVVRGTPVVEAIQDAYYNGAVVAGTSAGAAVMSKNMLTGRQLRDDAPDGYRTIQSDNIELVDGLGLLPTVIIDQHFLWRSRLNRLVSASIQNPDQLGVGIDESTAIVVQGNTARVAGESQVVVIHNREGEYRSVDGLLGAQGMKLSVYLPGEFFNIVP